VLTLQEGSLASPEGWATLTLNVNSSATAPPARTSPAFYVSCASVGRVNVTVRDGTGRYASAYHTLEVQSALLLRQAVPDYPFSTVFTMEHPRYVLKAGVMELRATLSPSSATTVSVAMDASTVPAGANASHCALSLSATTAQYSTAKALSVALTAQQPSGSLYLYCPEGTSQGRVLLDVAREGCVESSCPSDRVNITVLPALGCGNGTRDSDEQCDDANLLNGDGCSADCQARPPCMPSVACSELPRGAG